MGGGGRNGSIRCKALRCSVLLGVIVLFEMGVCAHWRGALYIWPVCDLPMSKWEN